MYDTFIFDLDGTLVTHEMDFNEHKKELEKILLSYALPKELIVWKSGFIDSFLAFREELLRIGVDGDKVIEEMIQSIRQYEVERAHFTKAIDGAYETLEYLKRRGYKIAIVTRNNLEAARISIENSDLGKFADLIVSRDDAQAMKPKLEQFKLVLERLGSKPENTVVVGDYSHEMIAGNELGCLTIGVLSGSGSEVLLKSAKMLFKSVTEMVDYF